MLHLTHHFPLLPNCDELFPPEVHLMVPILFSLAVAFLPSFPLPGADLDDDDDDPHDTSLFRRLSNDKGRASGRARA